MCYEVHGPDSLQIKLSLEMGVAWLLGGR